uniref:Receptor-like protein kinase BRI1-like protein 3 n=1 Tax=Aegilops tauschii TaxID=37682 RepID=M8BHX1_AEGTA
MERVPDRADWQCSTETVLHLVWAIPRPPSQIERTRTLCKATKPQASSKGTELRDLTAATSPQALHMKGFDEALRRQVESFTQKGSVGIKVNDDIGHYFQTHKGLRQGDPMSPILFNIVVDMLAILIGRAKEAGQVIFRATALIRLWSLFTPTEAMESLVTGSIRWEMLGNLSNLQYLNLNPGFTNTGAYSTDITWLSQLSSLVHLDLSCTNLSTIVHWLPVVNMLPSLKVLCLSTCDLRSSSGPLQLTNLTSLETLDLSANYIHARITPNWFHGLTRLKYLDISRNGFYGPFPDEIGNMTSIVWLDLSQNSLVGMIPSNLKSLCSLEEFIVYGNNINGTITEFFQRLPSCSWDTLINLNLPFSNLTGSLPTKLEPLRNLIHLNLAGNNLTGVVPLWIGELTKLTKLDLSYNNLHGFIHEEELTKLVNLQYLDLAYNNITGSIPKSIVNCKRMITRDDGGGGDFDDALNWQSTTALNALISYTENSTVVTKGQERLYTGEIIYMVNLDLSCNNLIGDIPEEISTLVGLKNLNLSWNSFSGNIPENIGALAQVESLDLSHNELSGEIPTSLSALTSLSRLNLSYNNLTGHVPSGDQLQTLEDPTSIYIGNPGLCGPPLLQKCSKTEPIPATREHHEDLNDEVSFFIAMGSGYVMGLWVVFCAFLFKRKWRVKWYSIWDRLCDWVYVQVAVTWASWTRKKTTEAENDR